MSETAIEHDVLPVAITGMSVWALGLDGYIYEIDLDRTFTRPERWAPALKLPDILAKAAKGWPELRELADLAKKNSDNN